MGKHLFPVVLHPPDDGGDLAPGQGVGGTEGAGAVVEVAFHDARGVQGLDIDVRGVGEGFHAGEVIDVQLQCPGGQLGHLETGDGPVQGHPAAPAFS